MPQCTSAASSRVERPGPSERHARRDTPPPSIGQRHRPTDRPRTGRISTDDASQRRHDGVRRAPEPIRSGRGGVGLGWGGTGALPRVGEGQVRGDLSDDGGLVQRGDQAQPAPTVRARQDIKRERPGAGGPSSSRRVGWASLRHRTDLRPAAPSRPWAPAPRDHAFAPAAARERRVRARTAREMTRGRAVAHASLPRGQRLPREAPARSAPHARAPRAGRRPRAPDQATPSAPTPARSHTARPDPLAAPHHGSRLCEEPAPGPA